VLAWQWALASSCGDGSLPSGRDIGRQHGRHERWGRLVKRSGLAGELDSQTWLQMRRRSPTVGVLGWTGASGVITLSPECQGLAGVLCLSLGSGSLAGGIVGRVHRDDRRPEVETGAPQVAAPT